MKKLAELTWTEAAEERAHNPIVLVPVGSTEAHGPHLPLSTDVVLSEEMAARAAVALETLGARVVIAPSLAYSLTDYAGGFSGTISLRVETAVALVRDVCAGFVTQGFVRVCLVNSHLEPGHIRALYDSVAAVEKETGKKVAFPDKCNPRWARTLSEEFKRGACHAGSYETSLVLASRPEMVRNDVRATLEPKPIDLAKAMKAGKKTFIEAGAERAYFGEPARATVDEGDALYALLTTMIVTTVRETWPELAT